MGRSQYPTTPPLHRPFHPSKAPVHHQHAQDDHAVEAAIIDELPHGFHWVKLGVNESFHIWHILNVCNKDTSAQFVPVSILRISACQRHFLAVPALGETAGCESHGLVFRIHLSLSILVTYKSLSRQRGNPPIVEKPCALPWSCCDRKQSLGHWWTTVSSRCVPHVGRPTWGTHRGLIMPAPDRHSGLTGLPGRDRSGVSLAVALPKKCGTVGHVCTRTLRRPKGSGSR
jgi:hypothetical protein